MSIRQLLSPILRRLCASPEYEMSPRGSRARTYVASTNDMHEDVENGTNQDDHHHYRRSSHDVDTVSRDVTNKTTQQRAKRPLRQTNSSMSVTGHIQERNTSCQTEQKQRGPGPTRANTVACNRGTRESRKPFSRNGSSQESLSKDEARKRMLSWRKTTRLRTSNDQPGNGSSSNRRSGKKEANTNKPHTPLVVNADK